MGTVLLAVAIGTAAAASVAALLGSTPASRRLTSTLAGLAAVALSGATARLVWAIWQLDFSFDYVSGQSRARSSGGYRLAALWGGAEGSLLLFATLLACVLACSIWRHRLHRWGIAVPTTVLATMAATIQFAADPFERAPLPAVRGAGLTPILEHPAMLYHPPILYLGLVATLVPFAVALGADGSLHVTAWATIRRWSLVAWTLLTIGLATGANWAYVELGWGGYWAWDPVENTVLMPWLVLTAALHVFTHRPLRAELPRTAVALAMAPFVLVLFGATVTRSGGLSSVHAFADATAIGYGLGVAVTIALLATLWRVGTTRGHQGNMARAARSAVGLLLAAGLALFMAVVVFMGVGLPLVPGSNRIVPAAFFNRVGTPVLVLTLLALAAGHELAMSRRLGSHEPGSRVFMQRRRAMSVVALAGASTAVAVAAVVGVDDWLALAVIGLGAAALVANAAGVIGRPGVRQFASLLGHVGFVVLALGIAGSAQSSAVRTVLAPGESQQFGSDLTVTYMSVVVTNGPRLASEASTATVTVTDTEGEVATLTPGLVSYPDRAVVLAETALHSTPRRDVQVVMRAVSDDGLATFDLADRPFQQLVWWGSTLITASGLVALFSLRRRSGQSSDALRLRASNASSVEVGEPSTGAPG